MASMRDAMKRLQVIYESCNPEGMEAANADKGLDEFTRLKKKIHADVKNARQLLRDREDMLQRYGTTSETAQAAYQVRVLLRTLKEEAANLKAIQEKGEKKRGKKMAEEELAARRETVALCMQHIEELENLEKRRYNDKLGVDKAELFKGETQGIGSGPKRTYGDGAPQSDDRKALFEGATNRKGGKKDAKEADPFASNLPDIDAENEMVANDFRKLNERNKDIDNELEDIGKGVKKLKEIALDMNQELDRQHDALDTLEKGVDKALDDLDNVNVKMKKILDSVMKGDRFMMNCIMICVLLALISFVASLFFQ